MSAPQGPPARTQRPGSMGPSTACDHVEHRGGVGAGGQAVAAGGARPGGDQAGPHHGAHHLGDERRGGAHRLGQGPARQTGGVAARARRARRARSVLRVSSSRIAGNASPLGLPVRGARGRWRQIGSAAGGGAAHGGAADRRGGPLLGGGVLPPRLRVSAVVASWGRLFDPRRLPGLIAWEGGRRGGRRWSSPRSPAGPRWCCSPPNPRAGVPARPCCAPWRLWPASGAGSGCACCTTNDNTAALRFYQRRGWDLVALHRDAVARDRELKPEIPVVGRDGIALRHALELERRLGRREEGSA